MVTLETQKTGKTVMGFCKAQKMIPFLNNTYNGKAKRHKNI